MTDQMRGLILSYSDCTHYLLATTRDAPGKTADFTLLKDTTGKPLRFISLYTAKVYWQAQGCTEVWLVSQSPYDEMIGNSQAVRDEMCIPLTPGEAR